VQRLVNIGTDKAFRTSSEALCILAGTTPIIIKTEEVVKQYNIRKRKRMPNTANWQRTGTQELTTPGKRRQNHRS